MGSFSPQLEGLERMKVSLVTAVAMGREGAEEEEGAAENRKGGEDVAANPICLAKTAVFLFLEWR